MMIAEAFWANLRPAPIHIGGPAPRLDFPER